MRTVRWRRGSFTVELACLMPLILLVIFGSIYLCFYVHNRAWLTAPACESVVVGSQERKREAGIEEARQRGKTLLSARLFGAENLQMQVEDGGDSLQMQFDADTVSVYGGLAWHLRVREEMKRVDPVAFIWKTKGLEGLAEQLLGDGET